MKHEQIRIDEIFGPTIQGEGALIGVPTVFVRTAGCDYRCLWCDTMHAVDPVNKDAWNWMTPAAIAERVDALASAPILVTISGGNPALWDLAPLIALLRRGGHRIALETQGSVSPIWLCALDVLTISPKPPSSGETVGTKEIAECIAAGPVNVSLKFVVGDDADYQFARAMALAFTGISIYVQPCNEQIGADDSANPERLDKLRWLIGKVTGDHWYQARVLPQLHTLVWGSRRGV